MRFDMSLATRTIMVLAITFPLPAAAAPEQMTDTGRVTSATVYPSQAVVTRELVLGGEPREIELTVDRLPATLRPGSLDASAQAGIELHDVHHRTAASGADHSVLTSTIEALENRLATNAAARTAVAEQSRYLDRLEGFTADAAGAELRHGLLDAESLERITLFAFAQRERLATRRDELERTARDTGKRLSEARLALQERTAGDESPVRQAVLRLTKTRPGPAVLSLRYTVDGVTWRASYTARALEGDAIIELEQAAEIRQASGEDWPAVALTLASTAPGDTADAPRLEPLRVGLEKGPPGSARPDAAADRQVVEINRDPSARGPEREARSRRPLLGFEQSLDGLRTVYHRTETQRLSVATHRLDATVYHLAQPVIGPTVYREAKLTNSTDGVLLPGKVSVYFDNAFAGTSMLPAIPPGEPLRIGLGADARVHALRRLERRDEAERAGARVVELAYVLEVRGRQTGGLDLVLADRLPFAAKDSGLRLSGLTSTLPLSSDPDYLEHLRPAGLLRWRAQVPPSDGSAPWQLSYGYTLTMDRSFHVALTPPAARQGQSGANSRNTDPGPDRGWSISAPR